MKIKVEEYLLAFNLLFQKQKSDYAVTKLINAAVLVIAAEGSDNSYTFKSSPG